MDVNVAAVCFILAFYSISEVNSEGQYQLKKTNIPEHAKKVFSKEQIAQFDGSDEDKPIYMAIKGVVFDVTNGKDFYGKGATYNVLVGKDSSRAVAKMSLSPEDLTHDLTGLQDEYLKSLDEIYEGTYLKKYKVVGVMDYLAAEQNVEEVIKDVHVNPVTGEHEHHQPSNEL